MLTTIGAKTGRQRTLPVLGLPGADPSRAHAFTRSAILALPVLGSFATSTFLLTRVLDWRLAVGAGLLVWLGAALLYLHLTHEGQ